MPSWAAWIVVQRGVGIEAGLLSAEDAETFIRSGLADRCVRSVRFLHWIEQIAASSGLLLQPLQRRLHCPTVSLRPESRQPLPLGLL